MIMHKNTPMAPHIDHNLKNAWHRQHRKIWSRPQIEGRSYILVQKEENIWYEDKIDIHF